MGYFVGPHSDLPTCMSEWHSPLWVTRISAHGISCLSEGQLQLQVVTAHVQSTPDVGGLKAQRVSRKLRTDVTRLQRGRFEFPTLKLSRLVFEREALHLHLRSHCCGESKQKFCAVNCLQ